MSSDVTRRGVCLVLSAAPGGGKTSVSRALRESEPDLTLSVSATTRLPRPGEQEGVHYFFRTPEAFAAEVAAGDFLEHASFLDRRYGTRGRRSKRHSPPGGTCCSTSNGRDTGS